MAIDLDALFHADLQPFIDQPMSKVESQLISYPHISQIPNQYVPQRKRVEMNPKSRITTTIREQRRHFASLASNLVEISRLVARQIYFESKLRSDAALDANDDAGLVQQAMKARKKSNLSRLERIQEELVQLAFERGWDAAVLANALDDKEEDYFLYPDAEDFDASE